MDRKIIQIHPTVEVFFTFPFWFGFIPPTTTPERRMPFLGKLAGEMNKSSWSLLPHITSQWEAKDFPNWVPSFPRNRKKGILFLPPTINSFLMESAVDVFDNEPFVAQSATESVYYYDYGLGAVDVELRLKVENAAALPRLKDLAEKWHDIVKEENKIRTFATWPHFSNAIRQALILIGEEPTSLLEPLINLDDGKIDTYGICLLLTRATSTTEEKLNCDLTIIDQMIQATCGDERLSYHGSELSFADSDHNIVANAGYEGQIAFVETPGMADRIRWLWRFAPLHWGILSQISMILLDVSIEMFSVNKDLSSITIHHQRHLRKLHIFIKQLQNEAIPVNFSGDGLDTGIYNRIWDAWEGNKLMAQLTEQADFLDEIVGIVATETSQKMQYRMSIVLFLFTILALSSTLAALIDTIDFQNNIIGTTGRILIILIAPIMLGFIGSWYVFRRINR